MDQEALSVLLREPEGESLDWKADFPPGLARGKRGAEWDKGRGTLLNPALTLCGWSEISFGVVEAFFAPTPRAWVSLAQHRPCVQMSIVAGAVRGHGTLRISYR